MSDDTYADSAVFSQFLLCDKHTKMTIHDFHTSIISEGACLYKYYHLVVQYVNIVDSSVIFAVQMAIKYCITYHLVVQYVCNSKQKARHLVTTGGGHSTTVR
jgi:hypothetical protein